jgi:nucleoid DNA-binding protein
MAKNQAPKKPLTQTQVITAIAEDTELARADVKAVFESLETVIRKQLGRNGPGSIGVGGLVKIVKVKKPARPAKKNVPNPFKPGEMMDVAAKPASKVIKVRPLKKLKDMV